jgi:hypothetical protein
MRMRKKFVRKVSLKMSLKFNRVRTVLLKLKRLKKKRLNKKILVYRLRLAVVLGKMKVKLHKEMALNKYLRILKIYTKMVTISKT